MKLFLDLNNNDIRVAGQSTRQTTCELFMNEKTATEPVELIRQLLHLLKLPGDQSITIEQTLCSKCKKNVSNISKKNHIEVNTTSKSCLTIWLKILNPFLTNIDAENAYQQRISVVLQHHFSIY